MYPTREKAWEIFTEYNKDEHLIKHGLTVEGVMRHFAKLYNGNPDEWGVVGLLHDVDYELYPEEHCKKTIEILNEKGIDEELLKQVIQNYSDKNKKSSIGLSNVYRRLNLLYGEACEFHVTSVAGEGTEVTFRIPVMQVPGNHTLNET